MGNDSFRQVFQRKEKGNTQVKATTVSLQNQKTVNEVPSVSND
jgi:hypothetical protein